MHVFAWNHATFKHFRSAVSFAKFCSSCCGSKREALKALVNEDTLLPMMFLGLRKLGNICCIHKMFLNKIRNIFCGLQTVKHLCRQQCVYNNVQMPNFSWAELNSNLNRPKLTKVRLLIQTIELTLPNLIQFQPKKIKM